MSPPGGRSGEQAYRVKSVKYQNGDRKILLQNENGPCPLLAASNALLLRGVITLPPSCIRNGIASLYDVVNMLGIKAMDNPRLHAVNSNCNQQEQEKNEQNQQMLPKLVASIKSMTGMESLLTTQQRRQQPELEKKEQIEQLSTISEPVPKLVAEKNDDDTSQIKKKPCPPQNKPNEKQLHTAASSSNACAEQFIFNEVLEIIPTLQDGMDINPRFTCGVTGYEYTKQLNAFDLFNVELVHGWLIDPEDEKALYDIVGNRTYNELIEIVIQGQEAKGEIEVVSKNIQQALLTLASSSSNEGSNEIEKISNNSSENKPAEEEEEDMKYVEKSEEWIDVEAVDSSTDEPDTKTNSTIMTVASNTANLESITVTAMEPKNERCTGEIENVTVETTSDSNKNFRIETEAELQKLREKKEKLDQDLTASSLINSFLNTTSHQLTHYGLTKLYDRISSNELCVFFRNNHFATITKNEKDGLLYLLVTDLGYANVSSVVWEKFDVINGDTEYVDANFVKSPTLEGITSTTGGTTLLPGQLLAQSSRNEADYQLALRMSMGDTGNNINNRENEMMAAAKEASLREYNGISTPTSHPAIKDNTGYNAPTATIVSIPDKNDSTTVSVPAVSTSNEGGQPIISPELIHASQAKNNQEESDRILAFQLRDSQNNEDESLALARELQAKNEGQMVTMEQTDANCNKFNQEEADRILAFQLRDSQNQEDASLALARKLQAQESNSRRQQQQQQQQVTTANNNSNTNCTIS